METLWISSKWTKDDLHGKSVEFRIPLRGGTVHGVGEFWVRRNPRGLLAIDVVTDEPGRNWAQRMLRSYKVPQAGADRIKRHPDSTVANFRLV